MKVQCFLILLLRLINFLEIIKVNFYIHHFNTEQRKKHGILIDKDGKPEGGKWTFDSENRKKYPKNKIPPKIKELQADKYFTEAVSYIKLHFKRQPW